MNKVTKHGITYLACGFGTATHYYHMGEAEVFPMSAYQRLHPQHCVMPCTPIANTGE